MLDISKSTAGVKHREISMVGSQTLQRGSFELEKAATLKRAMMVVFQMGVPSILAFFLVSHQLFLHSAAAGEDKCPASFQCGTHGQQQFKFPLSNSTFPQCGLYTVNCSGPVPKLNLSGEVIFYEVLSTKFNSNSIRVKDPYLGNLIKTNSCDLFSFYMNWTLPPNPFVSFTFSPRLTLFKCPTINPQLDPKNDDFFRGNNSYKGCLGYTVFYNYRDNPQVLNFGRLPNNCSVFELPVLPRNGRRNASDLFSVLASEFSIEFNVSMECSQCRKKGRRCSNDSQEFNCLREKEGGSRLILILTTGASAGVGIFVILVLCITRKRTRSESTFFWKNKLENYRNVETFLKSCGSLSPKRYTYSEVKKMTNSFRVKLGQGGYGFVFKGKLENGCLVAVKVLKGLKGNGEEFINEVATISRTSHVNIVNLLGFCFDGCHRALIYEFMPNGSLEKFIHDVNSSTYRQLGWESLYQIAVGIARGLEYLHRGCNTRILHFDIKPHNILLDEDFCPKISDFGLAKLCPRKESIISLLGARGTFGYIAPEVLCRNFGGVSHKSDVYSYGMMALEMVGGRKNISVEVDRTSEIYFPHWIYDRIALGEELGLHGIMNNEANESARKMIVAGLWCIQTDPSHRPSMSRVVEMLEGSLGSLPIPPKPYLSSPSRPPPDSSATLDIIAE